MQVSPSDVTYYSRRLARWPVILLLAYLALKIVPVYGRALRFEYNLDNSVRFGATVKSSAEEIQQDILLQVEHLKLPVRSQDVDVRVYSQQRLVMARVSYQVPVELGPRRMVLDFHPSCRERALMTAGDIETLREVLEPFQQGESP